MKTGMRLSVLLLLLFVSVAEAQAKKPSFALDPSWRPAASELLELVTADRYETDDILSFRPDDFDEAELERCRTMVLTNAFKDVNEEFECRYRLFRYALARLTTSTDDPSVEKAFKRRYLSFQDLCRRLARKHAFADAEHEREAEFVKDPFQVYRHFLFVYLDELALQLETREKPERPFTLAEDYINYPSATNKRQLKRLFFSINQYFDSRSYTWNRYINKYKFQLARKRLFLPEWERAMKRYHDLRQRQGRSRGFEQALNEARESANFTYRRLKKESDTNSLPYFSKVDAFYLSDTVDGYFEKVEEEKQLATRRRAVEDRKEVVIFVHGLGEGRCCWGEFPELLDREDTVDPTLEKYYSVYVFQYATEEKSKGVDDFVSELAAFIEEVKAEEHVRKVTIIGHSFGGVITLRYLTSKDPRTGNPYRDNVARFVGIAPSLHGSYLANLVVELFGEKEKKFERHLPLFAKGMPFVGRKGDLQIIQNQIGSNVNLTSFNILDRQNILTTPNNIEVLVIIGDPWMPWDILLPGGRSEDDDLVKTYSANVNHIYMTGQSADKNIGYSGARVRYTDRTHFAIIKAIDRNHISYRYVTSFLKGGPLPQQDLKRYAVKYFLAVIRVFPADSSDRERYFLPTNQMSPTGELLLPALRIKASSSGCVKLHDGQWNLRTGVYFVEGHIERPSVDGGITVTMSADGYESRALVLPVRSGQVTYAVDIALGKPSVTTGRCPLPLQEVHPLQTPRRWVCRSSHVEQRCGIMLFTLGNVNYGDWK